MSYIEIKETVAPSSKMVLSLWFRVPAASIAAAKSEWLEYVNGGFGERQPLTGVVPLAVFGSQPTVKRFENVARDVGTLPSFTFYSWNTTICGWSEISTTDSRAMTQPHNEFTDATSNIYPSYIGVDCSGDVPKLSVNIVMPDGGAIFEGSWPAISSVSYSVENIGQYGSTSATDDCTPPIGNNDGSDPDSNCVAGQVLPFEAYTITTTYDSNADVIMGCRPETFRTLPTQPLGEWPFVEHLGDASAAGGQEVTPDEWHHLLLSVDLSTSCTAAGVMGDGSTTIFDDVRPPDTEGSRTTSACRMWISFDDVNLTGKAMSAYWPSGFSDQNAILPVNGFYVAGDVTISESRAGDDCHGNTVTNSDVRQTPSFSYSPEPFEIGKVCLPASAIYVDKVKHVEMGEFQLFTDVTVDPADDSVRRAFITDKGKPASLKDASDLLGKEPEVLLHRSSNWKKARNTGSLADPTNNPGGLAVGKIKTFVPNPVVVQ
jgi:hypothetical protein